MVTLIQTRERTIMKSQDDIVFIKSSRSTVKSVLSGKPRNTIYMHYASLYSCELAKQITLKRTIGVEAILKI